MSKNNIRYWDVRLTDRAAVIRWLERDGTKIRGESEGFHRQEEKRRDQLREKNPFEVTEQGIEIKDVPGQIPVT
jgi:hypothetical protein